MYQPWASAVSLGLKKFETRSWCTAYRGPLLIHAGNRWTEQENRFWSEASVALCVLLSDDDVRVEEFAARPPLGCIVAVADLVECWPSPGSEAGGWFYQLRNLSELERLFGDFSPNRWCWQLENVVRLAEPIPCRGAQGLWNPSCEVVDRLPSRALSAALGMKGKP